MKVLKDDCFGYIVGRGRGVEEELRLAMRRWRRLIKSAPFMFFAARFGDTFRVMNLTGLYGLIVIFIARPELLMRLASIVVT